MYFTAQSGLHTVINFLRPRKSGQNMLYLSLYHWPIQNSAKFRENVEILQKQANSAARLKILQSVENWSLVI